MDAQVSQTENFKETIWKQTASIMIHGEQRGAVEVCYLEEMPENNEGPFLKEERSLINAIAEQVGELAERKQMQEVLREVQRWFSTTLRIIGDAVSATWALGVVAGVRPTA